MIAMISKTHLEQVTHTKMISTIIQRNSPATLSWDPSPQNLQLMPQNTYCTGRNGSVLSAILCLKWLTNTIYVCKTDIGTVEWKLLHFTAGAVGIILFAPANSHSRNIIYFTYWKNLLRTHTYIHTHIHYVCVHIYTHMYR